jgi:hypothetical protein
MDTVNVNVTDAEVMCMSKPAENGEGVYKAGGE